MDTLLPAIAHADFDRLKAVLDNLGAVPPQVLLLEGGSEAQRMDTARYWAARINCPTAGTTGTPCLACPACQQIAAGEHLKLNGLETSDPKLIGKQLNRIAETARTLDRAESSRSIKSLNPSVSMLLKYAATALPR